MEDTFKVESRGFKTEAGKGDHPRNCLSQQFRDNYDLIDWSKHKKQDAESSNDHQSND